MKKYLTLILLTASLNANNITSTKTSCIQQSAYPNNTLAEQKKILIEKAKQESLEELYGTLISSRTNIEDGKLKSDEIKSRAVGAVRVQGDPEFKNGKNLGEICATVASYVTPEDVEKYSPKEVLLKHFCFNDTSVAMKNIKNQARLSAYKEMIIQYKPSMKNISKEAAENLLHGFKESNSNFDFDSASYCFDAVGTILPYELEMTDGKIAKKEDLKVTAGKVVEETLKTAIKIIKNKGYAKVYYFNGTSSEFNVDFDGNGFIFNKKDFKKMQSSIANGKKVTGAITTKLIIPNDIKTNTVDVNIKGLTNGNYSYTASYDTYINGAKNKSALQEVDVQHSNGMRYIELTINFDGKNQSSFSTMARDLASISYSVEGAKLIPFILDKSSLQKAKTKVYYFNGTSSEFNVDFDGNGFIFNKKDFEKMQSSIANGKKVTGAITTKLIIPNDIKTNTVDVNIKGLTNGNYSYTASYDTYINGAKNKSALQGVDVQHSNGMRYIELTINFDGKNQSSFSIMARDLTSISYSAADTENGEIWYDLNSLLTTEDQKVQLEFNKNKSTADFNGNGFIFNKKDFKKMQRFITGGKKVTGAITTKLIIPNDIKTNTVDVNIKGLTNGNYSYTASYDTYINGAKNKSALQEVDVQHSNSMRYIELTINFDGKNQSSFSIMARDLTSISYSAADTENGEIWYDLKPAK